jgi:hypothetical protein
MITCDRCGKPLPPGSTKYLIVIQATADFDGFLNIGDFKYSSDRQLDRLIDELKEDPPDKTMQDVYEKRALILCPSCKKIFMENPLNHSQEKKSANNHIIQ